MGTPLVFIGQNPLTRLATSSCPITMAGRSRLLLTSSHRATSAPRSSGTTHGFFFAAERKRGWLEAHQTTGLPVDESLVREGMGKSAAAELAVDELLDSEAPPTALFTAQNFISIGAVRALHKRGVQHQVAQACFDDIDLADAI